MAQYSSIGSIRQLLGFGGISVLLAACGAAVPPQELVDARSAYQQAVESPASEWAPAKLDTARQSLEEAEAAFEDDPDGEVTRDLAYIAERRARASVAAGQREQNKRRLAQLEAEYQELERKRANMTKEELAQMRERLDLAPPPRSVRPPTSSSSCRARAKPVRTASRRRHRRPCSS